MLTFVFYNIIVFYAIIIVYLIQELISFSNYAVMILFLSIMHADVFVIKIAYDVSIIIIILL